MDILLDTHIILWAIAEDNRLPHKAYDLITSKKNRVYYSIASVWEVAIKHMAHPEKMGISGEDFSEYCQESGYIRLNIRESHIFTLKELCRPENAPKHNDPFDRIMISQAKVESMKFVTHDSLLPYYGEPCIEFV